MTSVSVFHVGCHKQLGARSSGNHHEDGLLEILEDILTLFAVKRMHDFNAMNRKVTLSAW